MQDKKNNDINQDSALPLHPLSSVISYGIPAYNLVMELCDTSKTTAKDLLHLITIDPYLMCITQKLYHYYHPEVKEYTDIEHIIIALSVNSVKNMILRIAEKTVYHKSKDQTKFLTHSNAAAVCSMLIAKENGETSLQKYYAAGLVHDIGKYITYQRGGNYLKGGIKFAKDCALPPELLDPITYHQSFKNYEGRHIKILGTVGFANYFVNRLGLSTHNKGKGYIPSAVLQALNIKKDEAENIIKKLTPIFLENFKKQEDFISSKGGA
ncbi:MAG: hypothetical protein Ta2G_13720 [Termitinemataceae bacterium]|nr:MAG: hypothetical protein Ta2G_13720 [Termitinemataceae bacterium]